MAEDFCSKTTGTFRVYIEAIPCGDGGVTCTKQVTFYFYNRVIYLTKGDGEPVSQSLLKLLFIRTVIGITV